jgi:acetate kinase
MLVWLLERQSLTVKEMADALEHASGLRGLAGTADMRELLERARTGDESAALAREVYLHRLRAGIAAMVAALGGLDALVFTGGVGENSAEIRALAIAGLDFLGVAVDHQRNAGPAEDRVISPEGSEVTVLVILAREDIQIAHETRQLLSPS